MIDYQLSISFIDTNYRFRTIDNKQSIIFNIIFFVLSIHYSEFLIIQFDNCVTYNSKHSLGGYVCTKTFISNYF